MAAWPAREATGAAEAVLPAPGAPFIAVWKYTYDYLTKTKGLNNLVWLVPFSGSPSSAY